MSLYRKIAVLLLLGIAGMAFAQQEYASGQLSRLKESLTCQGLPLNCTKHRIAKADFPERYMYAVQEDGILTHAGLHLFSESADRSYPVVLYEFIERYFLLLWLQSGESDRLNLLDSDHVVLQIDGKSYGKGERNFAEVLRVLDVSSVFSLSEDSASYHAIWMNLDRKVELKFPKQYDLILGMDKKELIQQTGYRLEQHLIPEVSDHENFQEKDLLATPLRNVFYCDNGTFLIPQMRGGAYVLKRGTGWDYFYDLRFPDESLLNLFSHAHKMSQKVNMHVKIDSYGTVWSNYLSVAQLTSFMCAEGCLPYVGIESVCEKEITGVALYLNRNLMYEHMLYFRIRIPQVSTQERMEVEAVLYPYIPLNNLSDLFHQEEVAPVWDKP